MASSNVDSNRPMSDEAFERAFGKEVDWSQVGNDSTKWGRNRPTVGGSTGVDGDRFRMDTFEEKLLCLHMLTEKRIRALQRIFNVHRGSWIRYRRGWTQRALKQQNQTRDWLDDDPLPEDGGPPLPESAQRLLEALKKGPHP